MAGGYATHGECFITDGNTRDIFWSYGGDMIGGSAPCLKFLKEIVMTCPWQEMKRDYINTDGHNYFSLSKGNEFYLLFFKNEMKGKTLWIGFREGSPDGNLYDAVFYDVKNCKVIKSCRINPRTDKIEITGWTAVTMKLAE